MIRNKRSDLHPSRWAQSNILYLTCQGVNLPLRVGGGTPMTTTTNYEKPMTSVAKERSSMPQVSWNLGAIIGIPNDSVLLHATRRL